MLFRAVIATIAAATLAFGAAVPQASKVAPFNPSAKPLPSPVYDAVDQPLTNGERLRRGMAPLPPKFKTKRFGIHAPGPVRPVPDMPEPSLAPPQPSGGLDTEPPIIFEGIVQVADAATGENIGYVSSKINEMGQMGVDRDYRTPIEVTFKTVRADAKPGSIEITNGDAQAGKYFGAVASEYAANAVLDMGAKAFAYLTRTAETKYGVGPMSVLNAVTSSVGTKLKAESSVWTANQFTGELAATWSNPGGASVETTVFYYKSQNALLFSSDPDAFSGEHKDAIKVKLTIINKPLY